MVCFGGFLFPFTNNIRQHMHIIIRRKAVLFFVSAQKTPVPYLPLALLKHCRDRLHTPAAVRRSIPGKYINVKTPKTLRTVIGVPVSDNGCAAVLAHKVLDTFLKSF